MRLRQLLKESTMQTTRRAMLRTFSAGATGLSMISSGAYAQNGKKGCEPTQHFRQASTADVFNACTNEYVRLSVDVRQSVQLCVGTDGSASFRIQTKMHGTGFGIDLSTETPTGTSYILNAQDKYRVVNGPFTGGNCLPFRQVETYREKLISKGGLPNSVLVLRLTLIVDETCHLTFEMQAELDCKG